MRLPAPIVEHPIESAIAGLLLLALLFLFRRAGTRARPGSHAPRRSRKKCEKKSRRGNGLHSAGY